MEAGQLGAARHGEPAHLTQPCFWGNSVADSQELDPLTIFRMLASLQPGMAPRLLFLRRAPSGLGRRPGTLLCLSASFNPMTVAHDGLIREASRMIHPQEVLLLLATANVDKGISGLPLGERLALLLRFAESRPGVSVAAIGPGRFVDKMEAIHHSYPTGTRLFFLLGFDTLIRLFDPKYYSDREGSLSALFRGSECIVANRGPEPSKAMETFLTRPDVSPFAERIHVMQFPPDLAVVSATEVRTRLTRGEPINDLIPVELQGHLEDAWKRMGLGYKITKPQT
jgi:nicotinic acid mononucleotide adenylyltransferase